MSAFVPRLPFGVSRKEIGVTSWLAAIESRAHVCLFNIILTFLLDDPSAKAHLSPRSRPSPIFSPLQRRGGWGSRTDGNV